jgi:hypothetical protein
MHHAVVAMVQLAVERARHGTYHADACELVEALDHRKAELDDADPAASDVTARMLAVARDYVEETTIPCTEWPTTYEIAAHLLEEGYRQVGTDRVAVARLDALRVQLPSRA